MSAHSARHVVNQGVGGLDRLQFGVIVGVLLMSVAWLVVYSTVVLAGTAPEPLPPALAARLKREHASELRTLEAQMLEIYGGVRPVPAGS